MRSECVRLEGPGCELRLHLHECVEGMREKVTPGSVSVVVTSPPYNIGVKYEKYRDTMPREEYLAWTEEWGKAVREALSESGSLFLNMGAKPKDPWVPFEVLGVLRKHFALQNVIHWIKSVAILKSDIGDYPGIVDDVVVGHYKPINSDRFLNDCHEYIFHLTKHGDVPLDRLAVGVPYQDKSNVKRWKSVGRDVHCRGNTWFIPYRTIKSRAKERPHPASFPPQLPEMCIAVHGRERTELVMDPFLGIGSTAIAAARSGCNFVGFEIVEDYFEEACRRVKEQKQFLRFEP